LIHIKKINDSFNFCLFFIDIKFKS